MLDVELATRLPGPVRLRTLTPGDAAIFARHVAADRAHLDRFLAWPAVAGEEAGAAELLAAYADRRDGHVLCAGAFAGDELVAGVVLLGHAPVLATVELGCWAVTAAEGRGVVRAGCVAALGFARDELGAERVVWQAATANTRSRGLAERLGFRHEGVARSACPLAGERLDLDVLSLVGPEIDVAASLHRRR